MTVDVSQAEITTCMTIGEALMIDAQKMQYGSLKIMHTDSIPDDVVAQLITFAMDYATLDPRPGEPRTVNP